MSTIGQKLIDAVRATADSNPTYIYDNNYGCCYVRDGQPSCLVGHAAWNLGLIDATFEREGANRAAVCDLSDILGLGLDDGESFWLSTVQDHQDTGYPWIEAVAGADGVVLQYAD